MKNPKVSIVLPCYNGATMIGEAIESVIAQTYQDWELIIVNDCSTDNTLEVAQSYAEKDQRIRVFSNEKNSKLPATLNHGFREAKGELWTWTSDDNLLLPTMLEEFVDYFDKHPEVGFVTSDLANIDINGNIISYDILPDNIQDKMPLNNCGGASFMYRSSIAKKIGEYREDLFLAEDYEYWMRLCFNTKLAHYPKVLYHYRVHANSLTATRKQQIAEKLIQVRLMYLNQIEERYKGQPSILAMFYGRIVDELKGKQRWSYYRQFARKMPIQFGLRYIFIHIPNKYYRKLRR